MTTLNVSLPEELKRVVDDRVAQGRFGSHSAYLRSLIRRDQKQLEREQLAAELLKRMASKATPMGSTDFRQLRRRLKSHLAPKRKAK